MSATRNHGLSRREAEIMGLHDAGRSSQSIARELCLDPEHVGNVVRNLSFRTCWANSIRFERRARSNDRRYVAALAAAGYLVA